MAAPPQIVRVPHLALAVVIMKQLRVDEVSFEPNGRDPLNAPLSLRLRDAIVLMQFRAVLCTPILLHTESRVLSVR